MPIKIGFSAKMLRPSVGAHGLAFGWPTFVSLVFFMILLCSAPLWGQDPDLQREYSGEGSSGLEEVFRTSDLPGETPTSARGRAARQQSKRVSVPKGAFRVGCICMDDSRSAVRSIGACSGHGGVRYWLYRTAEGDTARVLTGNHERHPEPLSAAELSEMAQKRAKKTQNLQQPVAAVQPSIGPMPVAYGPGGGGVAYLPAPMAYGPPSGYAPGWLWPVALVLSSAFLYMTVRFALRWAKENEEFVRHALSDFIRHRKRPASRKGGKDA